MTLLSVSNCDNDCKKEIDFKNTFISRMSEHGKIFIMYYTLFILFTTCTDYV